MAYFTFITTRQAFCQIELKYVYTAIDNDGVPTSHLDNDRKVIANADKATTILQRYESVVTEVISSFRC